jgi:hypothetical protein
MLTRSSTHIKLLHIRKNVWAYSAGFFPVQSSWTHLASKVYWFAKPLIWLILHQLMRCALILDPIPRKSTRKLTIIIWLSNQAVKHWFWRSNEYIVSKTLLLQSIFLNCSGNTPLNTLHFDEALLLVWLFFLVLGFTTQDRNEDPNTTKSYLVDPASNICLSQRLSHACLSINNFILWNCVQLIKSVIIYLMVSYYTWIPVVILELIHAKNSDSRRNVFIR